MPFSDCHKACTICSFLVGLYATSHQLAIMKLLLRLLSGLQEKVLQISLETTCSLLNAILVVVACPGKDLEVSFEGRRAPYGNCELLMRPDGSRFLYLKPTLDCTGSNNLPLKIQRGLTWYLIILGSQPVWGSSDRFRFLHSPIDILQGFLVRVSCIL